MQPVLPSVVSAVIPALEPFGGVLAGELESQVLTPQLASLPVVYDAGKGAKFTGGIAPTWSFPLL